ncbi:MAG: NAD-dependent epimerase/dehydratase family protein [Candidatus Latescibacteria bacterium]|nr:NAD-dependent epimerase/dehydratase family protein [Candidatus Latescibacterota bacterium]
MKKTVVFGAAGWLGRAVLQNLAGHHQLRAFDYGPEAWGAWAETDGGWDGGETIHGDLASYPTVEKAVSGMDYIIHTAVYFGAKPDDDKPFLINLKGLWNVLQIAHEQGIEKVVHIGSCQTVHPKGVFFESDVRRPDGSLYAVGKRLQEEMCRQFHEAFELPIVVLRPDYIVDSRIGLGRQREKLENLRNGCVCRHDLAQACRLALENEAVKFDILHTVGMPEADATCNTARGRDLLGLTYEGDLDQYR